jgi:uncharacterized membrane protein
MNWQGLRHERCGGWGLIVLVLAIVVLAVLVVWV